MTVGDNMTCVGKYDFNTNQTTPCTNKAVKYGLCRNHLPTVHSTIDDILLGMYNPIPKSKTIIIPPNLDLLKESKSSNIEISIDNILENYQKYTNPKNDSFQQEIVSNNTLSLDGILEIYKKMTIS